MKIQRKHTGIRRNYSYNGNTEYYKNVKYKKTEKMSVLTILRMFYNIEILRGKLP